VKSGTWDDAILAEHRAYLREESARTALDELVRAAIEMRDYEAQPGWHGEMRDFGYYDSASGERPFAFIVNRQDLLFYVRTAELRRVAGGFDALKRQFPTASENSRGEWTVRIATKADAERLNALLFSHPASSAALESNIPDGITREDVLGAIKRLDAGETHQFAESVKYDLVYDGRRYAPKAVVGLAAERLAGRKLGPYDFKGGEESKCFRILRQLQFQIEPKPGGTGAIDAEMGQVRSDPTAAGGMFEEIIAGQSAATRKLVVATLIDSIRYLKESYPDRWVLTLHPQYVRLIAGMVLCLQFRKNGDASALLLKELAPAPLREDGGEYQHAPGCIEVSMSIDDLVAQFDRLRAAHRLAMAVCAETHAGTGGHRQAHSPGLVTYLERQSEHPVQQNGQPPLPGDVDQDPAVQSDREIFSRTDIGPAQKQTLVNARRGQGLFRERVISLEGRCRVTGVDLVDHLRASHIKPWKDSTDQEKLDGNNGLLLCPNIDHLFDQGYISFTDVGDLLVSKQCPAALIKAWVIDPSMNVGPFRVAQRPYLAYHRTHVLKE
jgi:hypothetical protein